MQGTYQGQKKFGQMYSITVDGDYLGAGPVDVEAELGISPGDTIEFETYKRGKYVNVDVKTIKKVAGGTAPAKKSGGSGNMTKNDYWEKRAEDDKLRQLTIEQQSSRKAAINMLDVILKNGAIAMPNKKASQYDFCMDLVDKITAKFNDDLEQVKQFETLPTNSTEVEAQEIEDELE